jgi:membrane protease YdiL (CAAX protease family)
MKDQQWFPPIPEPRAHFAPSVLVSLLLAVAFGWLVLARGHRVLAIAVWTLASALALALVFPPLRRQILRITREIGKGAGNITAWAVLWPFYVVVFGGIRLALSVARVDLLGLRFPGGQPSYWRPAPPEQKRAKYYQRLFTVDAGREESHTFAAVIAIVALVLILAVSGEVVLRLMGFGHPIVYRIDPRIGYYPAPHQDVHRYGGEIHINGFGMRSRDVAAAKPPGTFRILMLGDSTLYGGSYLDQHDIYASRLEGLLNQKVSLLPGSPRVVEVLCMGVNGWGPQHELAYVAKFGLFQADLVMVMGPPNDAYRPRYGIEQMPFFVEGHRPRFAWQEFWEHLLWQSNQRMTGASGSFESGLQAANVLADGLAAWLEIAQIASLDWTSLDTVPGKHIDFEFLPNEGELRADKPAESTARVLDKLLPELSRREIPEAYPLEILRRQLGVPKLYHDGAHLDSAGHEIYATYLRDRILQLFSAP